MNKIINYIEIKNNKIPVKIINNIRMKRIKISFLKDYLLISKPKYVSNKKLLKMINSNEEEIYNEYIKTLDEKTYNRKWKTGEKIIYKGIELNIVLEYIKDAKVNILIDDKNFNIKVKDGISDIDKEKIITNEIKKLFKANTYAFLDNKLEYWCNVVGVKYNSLKVKYAKTRWGSCVKSTGSLNFNSLLIMLPEKVADAIIVHELCHLIESNHGDNFWNLVYKYIPDYKERNLWIKKNMKELHI